MIEEKLEAVATKPPAMEGFSLVELLIVFAKYKKLIIGLPLLVSVIALVIGLLLPNVYSASTKLLPPQQAQSGAAALLSQLGGVAGAAAGVAGLKNPNDLYVGILKSRSIADNLVKRFNLAKLYDTDSLELARKKLDASTTIVAGKDGLITIDFENTDKKLVAPVANAYVDELIKLTSVLAVTEAGQRRMFFGRQLEQAKDNLASAELGLKQALDTRGVISVDSESRTIVETVGRVRAQISAKEIQLNAMSAFITVNNQEYKRVQEELNSLRAELAKLENGRPSLDAGNLSVAGKQIGLENIKILRDVKYYQMLYELLAKQYEAARLDEAKDSAVVQVLDVAVEPERKSKPSRALLVLASAGLAFIVSLIMALMLEARARALQVPMRAEQWLRLKSHLRLR